MKDGGQSGAAEGAYDFRCSNIRRVSLVVQNDVTCETVRHQNSDQLPRAILRKLFELLMNQANITSRVCREML